MLIGSLIRDILSAICLFGGVFCCLTSVFGYHRLPDFYTRCHVSGVGDTLGTLLVCVGFLIQAGFSILSVKIVILFLLICICNPIGGHILDRTGRKSKFPMTLANKEEM